MDSVDDIDSADDVVVIALFLDSVGTVDDPESAVLCAFGVVVGSMPVSVVFGIEEVVKVGADGLSVLLASVLAGAPFDNEVAVSGLEVPRVE